MTSRENSAESSPMHDFAPIDFDYPMQIPVNINMEMRKYELNKLCMDETDPMINAEVQCKHDILLQMQTSWSDRNPGRRFWVCPHYEATNYNYFRWRDLKRVDERSKFILPRLVNKINELEKNYESVKMQLNKLESLKTQRHNSINMNLDDLESKQENDFENMQTKFQSLNIKTSRSKMKNEVDENVLDRTGSACVTLPLEFDGVAKLASTDGTGLVFVDLLLEFDGVAKLVPTIELVLF
ncbi:putative disease resistance protein-like [Capsicum annuum]|nr:putative disease resistance protein-like [Capsicum annuum]